MIDILRVFGDLRDEKMYAISKRFINNSIHLQFHCEKYN